MSKIIFSIVIPTHNRYKNGLLEEAVNSALSQKSSSFDWEVVIVDDASTDIARDSTLNKLRENSKVRTFILDKNVGTPGAISRGIRESKGEYIIILGDDDLLPPDSLLNRFNYLMEHPGYDWFYAKTQLLDAHGRKMNTISQSIEYEDHHYARMFLFNYIQGGTTTVKRSVYEGIQWPDWLSTRDDDFIAFELTRSGRYKFGFLNKVVYGYRLHQKDERQSANNLADAKKLEVIDNRIRYELNDPELAFLADMAKGAALLEQELVERDVRLAKIYGSLFWRVTFPLRKIARIIRR